MWAHPRWQCLNRNSCRKWAAKASCCLQTRILKNGVVCYWRNAKQWVLPLRLTDCTCSNDNTMLYTSIKTSKHGWWYQHLVIYDIHTCHWYNGNIQDLPSRVIFHVTRTGQSSFASQVNHHVYSFIIYFYRPSIPLQCQITRGLVTRGYQSAWKGQHGQSAVAKFLHLVHGVSIFVASER